VAEIFSEKLLTLWDTLGYWSFQTASYQWFVLCRDSVICTDTTEDVPFCDTRLINPTENRMNRIQVPLFRIVKEVKWFDLWLSLATISPEYLYLRACVSFWKAKSVWSHPSPHQRPLNDALGSWALHQSAASREKQCHK